MEQTPQTIPQSEATAIAAPQYSTQLTDKVSLNTLAAVAKRFANSMIVPEMYQHNEDNCFVACEMANRMGVSPLIVMQNLYIVKGKPAWSGQACISLIKGTGEFSPLRFVFVGEENKLTYGCYVECTRKSDGELLRGSTITLQMAKDEGWLDKTGSKWKTMPEQMMQYRAAAFFARIYCPAALMGLQTTDEVEDVHGAETEKQTIVIKMED